jgi:DNA (cytosine-5)-methyltransferase 1
MGKPTSFNMSIVKDNDVCPTIPAAADMYRVYDKQKFTEMDYTLASSFPIDYDFLGLRVKYVVGMSVPPLMIANVAQQIQKQWLDLIK